MTVEGVASVILSPDLHKVLLIKRRDVPVWALPGGGIDKGEDALTAIKREIKEETGLDVASIKYKGTYHPISNIASKTYLYTGIAKSTQTIKQTEETVDCEFFPINNLPEDLVPFYKTWIEDSFSKDVFSKKLTYITYTALFFYIFTHPSYVLRFLLSRYKMHWNSK